MTAVDIDPAGGYRTAGPLYFDAGWRGVLILPGDAKYPPPDGYTGWRGRITERAAVGGWAARDGADVANVALRLPPDIVGVGVDDYADKHGAATLAEMERAFGPLPATWTSTARGPGVSGIRLFRVPVGTYLQANPGPGIEIVQHHHRYAVVWPSVHPATGDLYRWYDHDELVDDIPEPDDVVDLPWPWIEGLAVHPDGRDKVGDMATGAEVEAFIAAHVEANFTAGLDGVRTMLEANVGSRHDALVAACCWAVREAAAGWYPAGDAVDVIWEWWVEVMDDDARVDAEFAAALAWAVGQVDADVERIAQLRVEHGPARGFNPNLDDDADDGEPVAPPLLHAAAFHGPLGEAALIIGAHTQADPTAVLPLLLALFGNMVGYRPELTVNNSPAHHANLGVVLVGPTGRGRKNSVVGYPRPPGAAPRPGR